MQQGDLVTSANAPEGCPPWVGEVVRQDGGWGNCWWVQKLGHPVDTARGSDLRPLTDAEAVGLAEMLSGGRWEPLAGESWSLLGSGDDDAVVMLAAPHQWRCLPAGSVEFVGRCHNIDHGKALASRALILYTIRGQP